LLDKLIQQKQGKADLVTDEKNPKQEPSNPYQIPATPNQAEATLEETAAWLKNKMEGSDYYSAIGLHFQIERLYFSRLSGCQMNLTIRIDSGSSTAVDVYTPVLNQAEKVVAGRSTEGIWGVWLYFTPNIYYEHWGPSKKERLRTDSVMLPTRDEDLAVRASKAFNHLIQLCGGAKKEPF
jgi:hypothetical protein